MIMYVTVSRELFLIGEAAVLVCCGLLTWRLSRRNPDVPSGPVLLVGLPGLYLVTLPSFYHAPLWLSIPGAFELGQSGSDNRTGLSVHIDSTAD